MTWRPSSSITVLVRQLDELYPDRTKPDWILGDRKHASRRSDHNPDRHGIVRAIDIRAGGGFDPQWLFDLLMETQDPRVSYVIHNRRWYRSYQYGAYIPWSVIPYQRDPHSHHIHLSVRTNDSTLPWELTMDIIEDGSWELEMIKRVLNEVPGVSCPIDRADSKAFRTAVYNFNRKFPSLRAQGNRFTEKTLSRLLLHREVYEK